MSAVSDLKIFKYLKFHLKCGWEIGEVLWVLGSRGPWHAGQHRNKKNWLEIKHYYLKSLQVLKNVQNLLLPTWCGCNGAADPADTSFLHRMILLKSSFSGWIQPGDTGCHVVREQFFWCARSRKIIIIGIKTTKNLAQKSSGQLAMLVLKWSIFSRSILCLGTCCFPCLGAPLKMSVFSPVIGQYWSRDLNTGLWLARDLQSSRAGRAQAHKWNWKQGWLLGNYLYWGARQANKQIRFENVIHHLKRGPEKVIFDHLT